MSNQLNTANQGIILEQQQTNALLAELLKAMQTGIRVENTAQNAQNAHIGQVTRPSRKKISKKLLSVIDWMQSNNWEHLSERELAEKLQVSKGTIYNAKRHINEGN